MNFAFNPGDIAFITILTLMFLVLLAAKPPTVGNTPVIAIVAIYLLCIIAACITIPAEAREYAAEPKDYAKQATYFAFAIWGCIIAAVIAASYGNLKIVCTALLLLGFITQCTPAHADRLYIGAWSMHTSNYSTNNIRYNETHYLLGYERKNYMAAVFKNSYNDWTVMAGRTFILFDKHNIQFTGNVGGNYGYRECYGDGIKHKVTAYAENGEWLTRERIRGDKRFCLHLIPGFRWTKYKVQPHLQLMPGAGTLTINYNF